MLLGRVCVCVQHGSRRQLDFPVPPATEYSKPVKDIESQPPPPHTPPYSGGPSGVVQVAASETHAGTSSEGYSLKVERMTQEEIEGEAKWQAWKFEKEIGKVRTQNLGLFDLFKCIFLVVSPLVMPK